MKRECINLYMFNSLVLIIKRIVPIILDFVILKRFLKVSKKEHLFLIVIAANAIATFVWGVVYTGVMSNYVLHAVSAGKQIKLVGMSVDPMLVLYVGKWLVIGITKWLLYVHFLRKNTKIRLAVIVAIATMSTAFMTMLLTYFLTEVFFVQVTT